MPFKVHWQTAAQDVFERLMADAELAAKKRAGKGKTSQAEGLFKQVHKSITLLANNPRHPGLHTHEFHSLSNPFDPSGKVFEAYAQNRTPGAYHIFWCYGPGKSEITIPAITPHP